MSLDRNYRRARRVLGTIAPSVRKANEEHAREVAAARVAIRAELEAGADPRALYDAEPRSITRRVILLGVLMRGLKALVS